MKKLFVYGTLMNEELLYALLKTKPTMSDAVLNGYQRKQIRGEHYPAIRPDHNSSVVGIVISNLSNAHIQKLDGYEGEFYKRIKVRVNVVDTSSKIILCETYVLKKQYYRCLSHLDWCIEDFRDLYLNKYIKLFGS